MAYGMENIAGMLARSGSTLGQQIGSPIQQFGTNIGQGISRGMLTSKQQEAQQEAEKLLKQYAGNPAQLNALSQKYAVQGNDALAKVFREAAQAASDRAQKNVAGMEASRASADKRAELARTRVEEMGTELKGIQLKRAAIDLARENKDSRAVQALAQDALDPQKYIDSQFSKSGSTAKASVKEVEEVIDGKPTIVFYSFDADGKLIGKTTGGEKPVDVDEEDQFGGDLGTAWGSALLKEARDSVSSTQERVNTLQSVLDTASELEQTGSDSLVGGIIGRARDFAVSDVAGLGDAITIHRAQLNSLRMQEAMKLLPTGPASDKDVALALNGAVNFVDLNPEQKVSYIRGMKKLEEARLEFEEAKVSYINSTGDPNALGFEIYAEQLGAENTIDAIAKEFPAQVPIIKSQLARAQEMANLGDYEGARALVQAIREQDTTGYLDALENLEASKQRFESYSKERNLNTKYL